MSFSFSIFSLIIKGKILFFWKKSNFFLQLFVIFLFKTIPMNKTYCGNSYCQRPLQLSQESSVGKSFRVCLTSTCQDVFGESFMFSTQQKILYLSSLEIHPLHALSYFFFHFQQLHFTIFKNFRTIIIWLLVRLCFYVFFIGSVEKLRGNDIVTILFGMSVLNYKFLLVFNMH